MLTLDIHNFLGFFTTLRKVSVNQSKTSQKAYFAKRISGQAFSVKLQGIIQYI